MKAALDNDILNKGICYGILPELLKGYGGVCKAVGILGAARFVLQKSIERKKLSRRAAALAELATWIAELNEMEPTEEEQNLAAEFELLAQRLGVNFDFGESQLCAIVIERSIPVFLTGDKRAITAAELMVDEHLRLSAVLGIFRCFEQAVLDILRPENAEAIRKAVCSEPEVDKTLTICFACASASIDRSQVEDGLNSYIAALRKEAGRVLAH